ncbi:MAG: hypothetical protein JWP81_966 [Ferruginibacter sp.]|nr:hypothetical protein [Ferruginibacter sp.]
MVFNLNKILTRQSTILTYCLSSAYLLKDNKVCAKTIHFYKGLCKATFLPFVK